MSERRVVAFAERSALRRWAAWCLLVFSVLTVSVPFVLIALDPDELSLLSVRRIVRMGFAVVLSLLVASWLIRALLQEAGLLPVLVAVEDAAGVWIVTVKRFLATVVVVEGDLFEAVHAVPTWAFTNWWGWSFLKRAVVASTDGFVSTFFMGDALRWEERS